MGWRGFLFWQTVYSSLAFSRMLRLSKRTRSQTGLREVHCRHSLIIVVESTPWWWQLSIRICLWIDVMGREICGAGRWAHLLVYEEREEDGEQKEEEMTIDIHRPTKQIHQQVIIDQCAFTSTHSLCTPGKVTLQQAIKPCRHKELAGRPAIPDPFPNTTQNALILPVG